MTHGKGEGHSLASMGLTFPAGRHGITVVLGAGRAEEGVMREKMGQEGTWFGLGKRFI